MDTSSPSERQILRRRLVASRERLDAAEHARLSQALRDHLAALLTRLQPSCIGFCWPHRREPDLLPLMSAWLEADPDRCAALPVVQTVPGPLQFRRWSPGDALAADRYGIPTPLAGEWLQPDVLLIPVNGFDALGFRLGYGGGYFDRTLAARRPTGASIGVGFELARLDAVPHEAHDQPLDWIVTERGAFHAEPRPAIQR